MSNEQFERIERMLDATRFDRKQRARTVEVEDWIVEDPELAARYIVWLETVED